MTIVYTAFNKYVFSDVTYLKWLTLAMGIDLLTGVTKVWVTKGWEQITSRGLRDTVSKCIQYGAFLMITHIVTSFEVGGVAVSAQFGWINKIAFEFLMLIETKSVYENLVRINPKLDFIKYIFEKVYNTYFKKGE